MILPSVCEKLINFLGLGDVKTFCRKSSSKTEIAKSDFPETEGFEPESSLTERFWIVSQVDSFMKVRPFCLQLHINFH